jgi:hypothetical protein
MLGCIIDHNLLIMGVVGISSGSAGAQGEAQKLSVFATAAGKAVLHSFNNGASTKAPDICPLYLIH